MATLQQYVDQLVILKKQWTPENSERILAESFKLRTNATLDEIDVRVLEREATMVVTGKEPSETDWKNAEFYLQPFDYAKKLAAIKADYVNDPDGAQERGTKLRMEAYAKGVDVYFLNDLSAQLHLGRAPTQAERERELVYAYEAILAKRLSDIQEAWSKSSTQAEKDNLHQSAQNIRAEAISAGIDLYRLERRASEYRGAPFSLEEREESSAYIERLYDKVLPRMGNERAIPDAPVRSMFRDNDHFGETFSGADMMVFMAFPNVRPLEVGTATTVTVTTYREKKQVRTIGRVSAKGITKSARTVSGKIILTVMREHIVESLKKEIGYLNDKRVLLMDELPPFDIIVMFGNEYGSSGGLVISGVTTVDEQKTMSIEEIFTENIFTYIARGYEPLRDINPSVTVPYNPLKWFTTGFRDSGSEEIAKFRIEDTLLNEYTNEYQFSLPHTNRTQDAWTSLSVEDIIRKIELPQQAITPPTDQSFSVQRRWIGIQIFDEAVNFVISNGKVHITYPDTTNKPPSEHLVKDWLLDATPYSNIHAITTGGRFPGALFTTELTARDKLSVRFEQEGYESVSGEITIGAVDVNPYLRLTTRPKKDSTSATIVTEFVKVDGPDFYDESSSGHKGIDLSKLKSIPVLTDSKTVLSARAKTAIGNKVNAEVNWTWELDGRLVPNGLRDAAVDPKNGYHSYTAERRLGLDPTYAKTDSLGVTAIEADDIATVGPTGNLVGWSKLPKDMIVIHRVTIDTGDDGKLFVSWAFRKG